RPVGGAWARARDPRDGRRCVPPCPSAADARARRPWMPESVGRGHAASGGVARATLTGMSRAAVLPPVLLGLVVLLLAQMVGLAASALLGLPVPGVVLGIVLLVLLGILRPTRPVARAAEPAATPLLAHLQLLFVPPSVGIVLELQSLEIGRA